MSHEVTVREDGIAEAAYAKIPAWHGLGQIVSHAMTSLEAMREAYLDWNVVQLPLEAIDGDGRLSLPNYFANVREDTKDILGVVGGRYRVFQNWEAFDFCDALVEDELLRYEAAISLKGGKTIVLLARMPGTDPIADGDNLSRFILFVNSHDGTKAVQVLLTSVRVVCANTLRLAFSHGRKNKSDILSIRHTVNMDQRIHDARKVLGLANDEFTAFSETAQKLSVAHIKPSQFDAYLNEIVPLPTEKGRKQTQAIDMRAKVNMAYYHDARQQVGNIGGTAWAAFNAISQVVDHSDPARKASPETKFNSTTFGTGNTLKQKAWNKAVELVA